MIKKYKQVVTEEPWGCKAQQRKWSSQELVRMTRTMVGGLPERVGVLSGGGLRGKNQDNCNSIINKIQLKINNFIKRKESIIKNVPVHPCLHSPPLKTSKQQRLPGAHQRP